MSDILGAIEKEREYLSYRRKNEEPFHLVDAVKEFGFESLAEFFKAKKEYQFSQLDFEVVVSTPSECIGEGLRLLNEKITGIVLVECDHTFVFSGESKPYNEEYCTENNIPVYPLYTRGGSLVNSAGDFAFGICVPSSLDFNAKYFLNKISSILDLIMPGITVEDNDIMLNGCKVCGTTGYSKDGMYLFIADFSFSDKAALIEKICGVSNSTKAVSYINSIYAGLFKQGVKLWLKAHSI